MEIDGVSYNLMLADYNAHQRKDALIVEQMTAMVQMHAELEAEKASKQALIDQLKAIMGE